MKDYAQLIVERDGEIDRRKISDKSSFTFSEKSSSFASRFYNEETALLLDKLPKKVKI